MEAVGARGPGRPAAATRADVVAAATRRYLSEERIDVQAVAQELALSRATIYRWFGSRERLVGEVVASMAERRLVVARERTRGQGARALLRAFERYNRELAEAPAFRAFLAHERDHEQTLHLITSPEGTVAPRIMAQIEELIRAEIEAGAYEPPIPPDALAYSIVRMAQCFLYNDMAFDRPTDVDRLRDVQAALLGIS
jgi:AcrR family transcriptional regulator